MEKIIQKRHLFETTLPFVAFLKSNMNRFQKVQKTEEKKFILRNILSSNLTINLLINFFSSVLNEFLLYLSIYVNVMSVRSKCSRLQKRKIKGLEW